MTEPKVSERMEKLVNAYALTVAYPHTPSAVNEARRALLSAIAEIEQRAEEWKEVAVALQKCRSYPQSDKVYPALNEAIAALGDEWDKAVR